MMAPFFASDVVQDGGATSSKPKEATKLPRSKRGAKKLSAMSLTKAVRQQSRAIFWPAERLAKNRLSLFLSAPVPISSGAKQRKKRQCG